MPPASPHTTSTLSLRSSGPEFQYTAPQTTMNDAMDVDEHPPRVPHRPASPLPRRAQSEPFHAPDFTVGYVFSSDMLLHVSNHGHPEQPGRITRIYDTLRGANLISKMKQIPIRPVLRNEALLVHTQEHWDKVLAIQCECSKCTQYPSFILLRDL